MNLTTTQKLFGWLMFSVLLALLAFLLGIINLTSRGINVDIVTMYEIVACKTPMVAAAVGAMRDTLASCSQCLYEPEKN
jgi:hypothetical protein